VLDVFDLAFTDFGEQALFSKVGRKSVDLLICEILRVLRYCRNVSCSRISPCYREVNQPINRRRSMAALTPWKPMRELDTLSRRYPEIREELMREVDPEWIEHRK
jgi:hypothetical protein